MPLKYKLLFGTGIVSALAVTFLAWTPFRECNARLLATPPENTPAFQTNGGDVILANNTTLAVKRKLSLGKWLQGEHPVKFNVSDTGNVQTCQHL